MKNHCRWLLSFAVVAFFSLSAAVVKATPYACEVTNVAGNIEFYMPESADDVKVIFDDGAVTTDLGALSAGANSFALGSHTNYSIVVTKVGSGVFHQISVDATNNSFFGPRGVTVNRNPGSSYFGRIYVCNASAGTGNSPGQTVGRGLYVLNADTSDCLGHHNTATVPSGMTLGASSTYSPYKPFVGVDNTVYIGNSDGTFLSLNPPGNAIVWACDPNLAAASVVFETNAALGPYASCVSTPVVTGSLAAGNLQLYCNLVGYGVQNAGEGTVDYTYIYGFSIGSGPIPWTSAPQTNAAPGGSGPDNPGALDNVDGILGDMYVAPDGKFFVAQDRNADTGTVSLWVYASDGVTYLWDSLNSNGGYDPFAADGHGSGGLFGVAVSPDDKYVAAVDGATGDVILCNLTNGVPDISTVVTNATGLGGTTRAIAFDTADNIYVASGGIDRLRVYSLGLTATCTTYNDVTGTNGTFNLVPLPTTVSVTTTNSSISQSGIYGNPTASSFTITRSGNLTGTVTVPISYRGTALGTSQYPASVTEGSTGSNVVLVPGQATTNITITAVADSIARPLTTVTIRIGPGAGYNLALPEAASINIVSTAPDQLIASVGIPSMYKAFSNDYCSFTLTRWGDTNAAAFVANNFTFSGTAVYGTDFEGTNAFAPAVTINPGDASDSVFLSPLINGQLPTDSTNVLYTGDKTILVSVGSGSGFSGSTNQAILSIIDNANPPATYLYYDPLTSVTDSNNWEETDANDNMQGNAIDSSVVFAYDLYDDPLDPNLLLQNGPANPLPFPPDGATNALRLTVNKQYSNYSPGGPPTEGTGAAGAVNLFLTNTIFSGNYAVRFQMNLQEGYLNLYTTEGALFGFNHTGLATNWWAGSGIRSGWGANNTEAWASDGIWCWVSVDDGVGAFDSGPADYIVLTGNGSVSTNAGFALPPLAAAAKATVANNFKSPVFTSSAEPGLAANISPDADANAGGNPLQDDRSWCDVELKQYNNIVTFSIDKVTIGKFNNTTSYTNGYVMLGYEDPYDSIGGGDAAVYYSNLRVVRLAPPLISETAFNAHAATYVFDFTSPDGEVTGASFKVVGSSSVQGPYTPVAGATIQQLGSGAFQATVPTSGSIEFYQIQQTL